MTRGILLALAALLALTSSARADSSALWRTVTGQCVPNQRDHGQPAPCAMVDITAGVERGYAIIKDPVGDGQYVLLPTAKIEGIEDPALLAPNAPNYFAFAWGNRHFTSEALKRDLPRGDLGLAVNSVYTGNPTPLHIRIDCLTIAARDTIAKNIAAVGDRWTRFPQRLNGRYYRARLVAGDTLDAANPFILLADGIPGARQHMDQETLLVVGATLPNGAPGFVLLNNEANVAAGDYATGEELQDHSCALAKE